MGVEAAEEREGVSFLPEVVGLRLQKRGFFTLWLLFYGLVWVGLFVAAGFLFAVDEESSNIRRPLLKALFCFSLAG